MIHKFVAILVIIAGCCRWAAAASLVDTNFNVGAGANGIVEQVLQQPDGRILICGNFPTFNGQPKAYLARLHNNGSVDETFTSGASYWVRHMALQEDGKIVIGGYFTSVSGQPRNRIARLNRDGSLDTTFGGGDGIVITDIAGRLDLPGSVKVQPDGKIVLAGLSQRSFTTSDFAVARLNADGTLDASFDGDGKRTIDFGVYDAARGLAVQADGKIVVAGYQANSSGGTAPLLARFRPDGSPDTSFGRSGVVAPKPGPEVPNPLEPFRGGGVLHPRYSPFSRTYASTARGTM